MLILNTCNFQKKILSKLTCALIYSLTKCVLKDGFEDTVFRKFFQKMSMAKFTVRESAVCTVANFLNETLRQK